MTPSLIDTDILSYFLKGDPQITNRISKYIAQYGKLSIAEITYFETLAGLEFKNAEKQIKAFEEFAKTCEIVKLSGSSIRLSARIYGQLRRKGLQIGTADLLISGVAIIQGLHLVSNNHKALSRNR